MLTDAQVYCMTSMIYLFRPPLTVKPSIGKRRKQSCTPNIIVCKIIYNYVWANFFQTFIFPNLIFPKTNNAKIVPLIIFDVFSILLRHARVSPKSSAELFVMDHEDKRRSSSWRFCILCSAVLFWVSHICQ